MNISAVAECIYEYTSGYPYLVSAICKLLDEEIPGNKGYEEGHVAVANRVFEMGLLNNFNKKKVTGVKKIQAGDKVIVKAVV